MNGPSRACLSSETSQHLYQESRGSNCNGINCESGLFKWCGDSKLSVLDIDQHPSATRTIGSSVAVIPGMTDSANLARHIRKALIIGMVKDRQKWLKTAFSDSRFDSPYFDP